MSDGQNTSSTLCECGCGQVVGMRRGKPNRFIKGHQARMPEARAKMSATRRAIPITPEHRARMAAGLRGIPKSPDHRANLRGPRSAEVRAKFSAMRKGIPKSPEFVARIAELQRGKKRGPHKPETKAKIAAAKRGKPHYTSPEHLAKLAAGHRRAQIEGRIPLPKGRRYTTLAQALDLYLAKRGVNVEPEVRFGPYTVDLYDRVDHVAYEADGLYWHNRMETKNPGHRARRDTYLREQHGLAVIHYSDIDIRTLTGWPRKHAWRVPEVAA